MRVHPALLQSQRPESLLTKHVTERSKTSAPSNSIGRNGFVIRKFFHSKKEQLQRSRSGSTSPTRTGSSRSRSPRARALDEYMHAYEEAIQHTATPHAPVVVPGNHKWFARTLLRGARSALEELNLAFPPVDDAMEGTDKGRADGQGGHGAKVRAGPPGATMTI